MSKPRKTRKGRRDSIPEAERCPTCDGTGHGLGGMWCINCTGTGRRRPPTPGEATQPTPTTERKR